MQKYQLSDFAPVWCLSGAWAPTAAPGRGKKARIPQRPVLFVALLLAVVLSLLGCEYRAGDDSRASLREQEQAANAPDQVTTQAQFLIYENDRPRALVEARRMERYEREDSTYTLLHAPAESPRAGAAQAGAGRVAVRIFGGEEEEGDAARTAATGERSPPDSVAAVIRADRLVYQDEEGRFDARGQVVVTTPSGKRLEGEHLAWHEAERRITTPGFVNIVTPNDRIQGYGLQAEEDLDTYRLERVTGEVTVEDTP